MHKIMKVLAVFALWLLTSSGYAAASNSDVIFRFATFGDSRQDPDDPRITPQDAIWLQETRVLSRITREIQSHRAQVLIFNGDMIRGYTADRAVLDRQYAYWRGMMAILMETGTYVLPVPGNHEIQIKGKNEQGETTKIAALSSEQAWRANMGDLILNVELWRGITGVMPTVWSRDHAPDLNSDGLTTDQRQLSYSFDSGDIHLVVMNTDPVGFDSSAPVKWLESDLAAAKMRGAKHNFVFGHKMAFTYVPDSGKKSDETGLSVRPAIRDAFWNLIETYRATYFCGHEHVYHATQPTKTDGGSAWQVIVGSGGSPFGIKPGESHNPNDRMYAWAEVSVYRNGRVHVAVHGFNDAFKKTRILEQWDLPKF